MKRWLHWYAHVPSSSYWELVLRLALLPAVAVGALIYITGIVVVFTLFLPVLAALEIMEEVHDR